ncbi:MFS transporter [bacterium]|nr:MFS transporter [bacterium]
MSGSSRNSVHWQATAALALATALASLGSSSMNIALPRLASDFHAGLPELQWAVLAYLLPGTALILIIGRLGDSFGTRRVLLLGLWLYVLGAVASALAPGLGWLLAARAVQGSGAAAMLALSLALAADSSSGGSGGRSMGLLASSSALGTALGPALGGLLLDGPGWRAVFALLALLALGTALLSLRALAPDPQLDRPALRAADLPPALLLSAGLTALMLALSFSRGSLSPAVGALLLAALVCAGLFYLLQRGSLRPLLAPELLQAGGMRSSLWQSLLVSAVLMASLVVGPFYLSEGLGLSSAISGLLLAAGPLVVMLSGPLAGAMTERFGPRCTAALGLAGLALAALLFALLPLALGLGGWLLPLTVLTFSYALFQTGNNTAVMAKAGTQLRAAAAAMLNLSRNLGLAAGTAVFTLLYSLASETAAGDAAAASSHGLHMVFAPAALLLLLALGGGLGQRPCRRAARPEADALLA